MLSIKNHIIFKNCINNCVNNIKNKFYGKTPWDISGPGLMKKYCKNYKKKLLLYSDSVNLRTMHKRTIIIKESNKIFCNMCYYGHYDKYFGSNYYITLWLNKKVYK